MNVVLKWPKTPQRSQFWTYGLLCLTACQHHGSTWERIARRIENLIMRNLIVRLDKDGKGLRKIGDQLLISCSSNRKYRTSHSSTTQSGSGRPKIMPWTLRYLHNLALLQTCHKGYQWKSVTAQNMRRTLHNVNPYGPPIRKLCLLFVPKLQD